MKQESPDQEYIPKDRTPDITQAIAAQFVDSARMQNGFKKDKSRKDAIAMANRFHSNILKSIDKIIENKT